jgi:hypothetical protein
MNLESKSSVRLAILAFLFILGISVAALVWNHISLPFSNAKGIVSPMTLNKVNPLDDTLRFLVFLLAPSILLVTVYYLYFSDSKSIRLKSEEVAFPEESVSLSRRKHFNWAAVMGVALIVALGHPTYHAWGEFDAFHEGETLAAATDYIEGKIPYKESLFVHGAFQDPIRAVLAFKLFGRSIGSVRGFESIMKILGFLILAIVLMNLFPAPHYVYIFFLGLGALDFAAKIFFPSRASLYILMPRDVITLVFFLTLISLFRLCQKKETQRGKILIFSVLFSCIPFLALGYSIDRGIYLCIAQVILSILIYKFLLIPDLRAQYILGIIFGAALGILGLGVLIKWAFGSFLTFAFTFSRDSELIYGQVYPIHKARFFIAAAIMALLLFRLTYLFLKKFHSFRKDFALSFKSFYRENLIECSFFLLALIFFKSALGRSDAEHLAYSLIIPLILLFFIVFQNVHRFLQGRKKILTRSVFVLIVLFIVISVYFIFSQSLLSKNFPFFQKDSEFIPTLSREPISFLEQNLSEDQEIYVFSSELAWYYYLNRASPVRWANIQMVGSETHQREVARDLNRKEVPYVIYMLKSWDNIENSVKYPILSDYIHNHFKPVHNIQGASIWERVRRIPSEEPVIIPSPRGSSSWFPKLAVDASGIVHFSWCETIKKVDEKDGSIKVDETVFYSSWNREKWTLPEKIIPLQNDIARNSIAVDNGRVYIYFSNGQKFEYYELSYKSADLKVKRVPLSWGPLISLGFNKGTYMHDVAARDNDFHMVFDRINGNENCVNCADIFYARTLGDQTVWSEPFNLFPSNIGSARPQMEIDKKGNIHVTWDEGWDRLTGFGEPRHGVYMNLAFDSMDWTKPLEVHYPNSHNAQLAVGSDGEAGTMLVWRTTDSNYPYLFYKWSKDNGQTWSSPERIPAVYSRSWPETPFDIYDMVADIRGHIHLLAVGHKRQESIRLEPPKLLHLVWDGENWSGPSVIYEGKLYPEFPQADMYNGNELHITWFAREELWKTPSEVDHVIFYYLKRI